MFIAKVLSRFQNQHRDERNTHEPLSLEVLEDRMMLSSVEIFAAGATGEENLDLSLNGEFQQTFFAIGGDASTGDFRRFTFETDQTITPGDVAIGFSNDAFDPSIGLDRDLFVDRIVVDGVSVEAEDPSTFSTGIFRDGGLTGPGFLQTEVLNINGTLTFADPDSTGGSAGDRIEFQAFGTTGEEIVDLVVDGQTVASFQLVNPGISTTFFFDGVDSNISIEDIRLEFSNDLFDADRGIDRNVQISEFRVIDGDTGEVQTAQTSDTNVLSSGIYVDGVGITEGFGAGGFLAGNGFVEIRDGGSTSGDRIEFDAFGTTGEEIVNLLVDGQIVETFGLFESEVTFTFDSADPNISIEDIRLEFVNDLFDADLGIDRNVQIFEFRVIDGDTGQVQTARTSDSNVLNSGIYVDGVGITDGFGAGGLLSGNGFVEIGDNTDGPTAVILDPNFQTVSNSGSRGELAVGPSDQIANANTESEILVVDSNGIPLAGFGDNGRVDDLDSLLGLPADSSFSITDLEFFDDGSLLVTGGIIGPGNVGGGPALPALAKLTPDGTLDENFQQGILQGSFIQLDTNFDSSQDSALNNLDSAIDSLGRIIVFGTNVEPNEPTNYVVSRFNPDGTIDSSFGNGGNVFLSGSSFTNQGVPLGGVVGVEVLDNGNIIFGFSVQESQLIGSGNGSLGETLAIGRLLVDGSIDRQFGDNGFFVREFDQIIGPIFSPFGGPLFEVTPSDGIVIAFSVELEESITLTGSPPGSSIVVTNSLVEIPALLLLNSSGELTAEVNLVPDANLDSLGPSFTRPSFRVLPTSLAIDQAGNIVVFSQVLGQSDIIQRVLPSGELDTGFGFNGSANSPTFLQSLDSVIFDSNGRLVTGGISRFEFV